MTAILRSELLKIRTTRGWWAYLIVLVGLVGIGTAAEVGSRSLDERSGLDFQLALVDLVGITSLLAIILGITMVTTEFRHGTITPTLLATPGRERVLAGKAVAGVLIAVFFAVLAFLVIGAVAAVFVAIDGGELQLADADVAERALEDARRRRPLAAARCRDRHGRAEPGGCARGHARLDLPRRDAPGRPPLAPRRRGRRRVPPLPRARRRRRDGGRQPALLRACARGQLRLDRSARRRRRRCEPAAATSPDVPCGAWPPR